MRTSSAILGLALACACAASARAESVETPIGRFAYTLRGEGAPLVVLEAGLGDGADVWERVLDPVARTARVLAYDRIGHGESRAACGARGGARSGARVVRELRALLFALALEPPYVLVGHSLGGQYVELFARAHPEEVAGVVLVDARHVDFARRCEERGVSGCEMSWLARLFLPRAAAAEIRAAGRTEDELRAAGPFPSVPLRVLSAARRPSAEPGLRRAWADAQRDLARLSPRGAQETCADCGHYVQREAPERVVRAIASVLREAAAMRDAAARGAPGTPTSAPSGR